MAELSFDAVVFDLDGVVTKTALVHASAWKAVFDECLLDRERAGGDPFKEFTHENDYLPYVDGKPRYEGVQSFLESRGIDLPYGQPDDSPEKETICGVGNRKNIKFVELLDKNGVEEYPSTVKLIKTLKEKGVRIGVASSSKNCRYVLKAAGIEDLFETRVDGEVSARTGLKGKPEGDIFVTAASNIGARPERSVVVEDATSGVQAGRNGAFGLVIGIARENNEEGLLANGADVVVTDLEYVDTEWIDKWFQKKPRDLFLSWEKETSPEMAKLETENIKINPCYYRTGKESIMGGKKPIFFFDYDGTLTPIVERPELAVISDDMKGVVEHVTRKYTTAIVSGRSRENVEKLLGIKGLIYAGNHGFDISGPGVSMVYPGAEETVPLIEEITSLLSDALSSIDGILIEKKKFSVAVHYRLVNEKEVPGIEKIVKGIINGNEKVRIMNGKKVFEILPAIAWDKGKAVRRVMEVLGCSWQDNSILYVGDDTTDEDAFRIMRTRGTSILVTEKNRPSSADFSIKTTDDVKTLLQKVLAEGK